MKKILFGIVIALAFVLTLQYCQNKKEDSARLIASSELIQKELKNVGKLIVTEGHYSQVFTYDNERKLLFSYTDRKSALVIVNAKATIAYDLRQVETEIDEVNKTVTITRIPEPELNIYPDIEYYKIEQGYMNKFQGSDHAAIKRLANQALKEKIEESELKANAEYRLISELQKIYILTNSLGWTLKYDATPVESEADLFELKL